MREELLEKGLASYIFKRIKGIKTIFLDIARTGKDNFVFIIENEAAAKSYKSYFDFMWEKAKTVKEKSDK